MTGICKRNETVFVTTAVREHFLGISSTSLPQLRKEVTIALLLSVGKREGGTMPESELVERVKNINERYEIKIMKSPRSRKHNSEENNGKSRMINSYAQSCTSSPWMLGL